MRERLQNVSGLNGRFESVTIDSFAWRIVLRWRSRALSLGGAELPTDFDARCDLAGRLLEAPCVQQWVAASFPIVVVDELQDSKSGQLRVLQGLAGRCACLAAGDPFQDLEGDHACPVGLIRFRRRLLKGGYDAKDGRAGNEAESAP